MSKYSITPELVDGLVNSFKLKLKNQKSVVTVEDFQYGDTQAVVCVNNIRVGRIISYFSNMSLPDHVKLYFFPDYAFFDHCQMKSINQFLNYSSQLLKNTLITLNVLKSDDALPQKKLLDFRFDFAQDLSKHFYATFCSNETCFYENGQIIYQLVFENNQFKLVDYFKYSINNHTDNIFAMKPFTNLLSVLLRKEDDMYSISDDSLTTMIYQIEFSEDDTLPDITYFTDIVFYYTVMIETNMERPTFEDYVSNVAQYKKIIQMSNI